MVIICPHRRTLLKIDLDYIIVLHSCRGHAGPCEEETNNGFEYV